MNKRRYLGLSTLDLSKICYMNTDSFIVHLKADDIYKDIEEDIGARFDTSNFEIDRLLHKEKIYDWTNKR